ADEDDLSILGGRIGLEGGFDAQQEIATRVAGVQPVEEGRAGASDVEVARGRGGEPNSDGVSHELLRSRRMSNAQCPMSNFEIGHWTFDICLSYGEGGIRTPDRGISPHHGLANRRL